MATPSPDAHVPRWKTGIQCRREMQSPTEQITEEVKPAPPSPALEGTGVFDLDTTQAKIEQVAPPAIQELPANETKCRGADCRSTGNALAQSLKP
jgi:hypothetical protein